ncbi:MAG: hypothetical protein FJ271_28070 [Planctomycetes bacterium]|nr:hypothetical protein [Planctomycetota bacterium]
MKLLSLAAVAGLLFTALTSDIFAKPISNTRHNRRCFTPEEKRLNRFWHDYYDSTGHYYKNLSKIDWVSYYKNHACPQYQSLGCTGQGIITYSPVVVNPGMHYLQPGYDPYTCVAPCCP